MPDTEKDRLTVYVSKDLAERIRRAVAFLAGHPLYLSMTDFAEEALRKEIELLEQQHNQGQPFPEPKGKKRPGRPVGS